MTPQKFEKYYHQYKDKIYTHVFYRVNNNADIASDLTADIFLKAFKKRSTYQAEYSFSTWIFTITKNTLTDYYRAHRDLDNIDEYDAVIPDDHDFIAVLDKQIDLNWIEREAQELPKKQKQCILLQLAQGLTINEIAERCEMKPDTVRKNLNRATKTLLAVHSQKYA